MSGEKKELRYLIKLNSNQSLIQNERIQRDPFDRA